MTDDTTYKHTPVRDEDNTDPREVQYHPFDRNEQGYVHHLMGDPGPGPVINLEKFVRKIVQEEIEAHWSKVNQGIKTRVR